MRLISRLVGDVSFLVDVCLRLFPQLVSSTTSFTKTGPGEVMPKNVIRNVKRNDAEKTEGAIL